MSIHSILVHLADDAGEAARVRVALSLARRWKARVEGVYTTPSLDLPAVSAGRAASAAFRGALAEALKERVEASERRFREACIGSTVSVAWRNEVGDAGESLTARMLYADLGIVGHAPVMLVPEGATPGDVGRTVLVAWKPRREAGRAVRDALPFLSAAGRVVVLTVDADRDGPAAAGDLLGWLASHGIAAEHRHDRTADAGAGAHILEHAGAVAADLVVMGLYGHSRLREMVFGGASRYVLRHARIPVLLSH
jgi:nucleotide-binding universal stress UspA family protein